MRTRGGTRSDLCRRRCSSRQTASKRRRQHDSQLGSWDRRTQSQYKPSEITVCTRFSTSVVSLRSPVPACPKVRPDRMWSFVLVVPGSRWRMRANKCGTLMWNMIGQRSRAARFVAISERCDDEGAAIERTSEDESDGKVDHRDDHEETMGLRIDELAACEGRGQRRGLGRARRTNSLPART